MSIIEKAAGKLGQLEKTEKPTQPVASPSIIEKASQKAEVEMAAPLSAQPKFFPDSEHPAEQVQPRKADRMVQPPLRGTKLQSDMAEIDLDRLRQLGGVTPNEEKTQIGEEFRIIKRPLIMNAFNREAGKTNNNLIMVTSALVGEGKSFCAVNLAISIAMEMDHTVLLVDADVARPSLPKYLGVSNETGLMDVLLDKSLDLSDVMRRTNIEKLSILTSGRKSRHATELLASQSMSDLLTEIAQRYNDRIVIFDSPPLLLTSESRVLATQMGQIVLVVEGEKTSQKAVKDALRQIESCESINLVYNKANPFSGGDLYGYYYH